MRGSTVTHKQFWKIREKILAELKTVDDGCLPIVELKDRTGLDHAVLAECCERLSMNGQGLRYAGYVAGRGPCYAIDRKD